MQLSLELFISRYEIHRHTGTIHMHLQLHAHTLPCTHISTHRHTHAVVIHIHTTNQISTVTHAGYLRHIITLPLILTLNRFKTYFTMHVHVMIPTYLHILTCTCTIPHPHTKKYRDANYFILFSQRTTLLLFTFFKFKATFKLLKNFIYFFSLHISPISGGELCP